MELVDTHSHIYLEPFQEDRSQVIAAAVEKGIRSILLPNIDASSIASMNRLGHGLSRYMLSDDGTCIRLP